MFVHYYTSILYYAHIIIMYIVIMVKINVVEICMFAALSSYCMVSCAQQCLQLPEDISKSS